MNNSANDEIFYSDDDFSDGESNVTVKMFQIYMKSTQDLNQQTSSTLSNHQSAVSYSYSCSSPVYRSSAPFKKTPYKSNTQGSYASSMNINFSPQKKEKDAPVIPSNLSYSAVAKKAGDVPQVFVLTNLETLRSVVIVHPRSQVYRQK